MKTIAPDQEPAQRLAEQQQCQNHGFTLLETMVALALCGLIVAALSTATHLYWKHRALSRGHVHTAHLRRGLTEDLAEALRSVAPLLEPPAPGTDSGIQAVRQAGFYQGEFSDDSALTGVQSASLWEPVPFVGMSNLFAVLTEHSGPRFDPIERQQIILARQHVVWWINDGSKHQIPLLFKGQFRETVEVSASDIAKGLVRTTISANTGESARSRIVRTHQISAEVRGLSLRYFDGTTWTNDWSMRDAREIPLLVECELSFADGTTGVLETFPRFLVAIPQGTQR